MNYNLSKLKNPRHKRKAKEHLLLEEFCNRSNKISYEVLRQLGKSPPDAYLIHYNVKSIIGINSDKSPIYGFHHTAEISFPSDYPSVTSPPRCYMRTPIWHPNIRYDEPNKGHICVNDKALGAWHTLDMLVRFIGEILQYKNYHAINTDPYPEDPMVAEWVRQYAEPMGIVNKNRKIYVDFDELLLPEDGFVQPTPPKPVKPKPKIKITKISNESITDTSQNSDNKPLGSVEGGSSIKITKLS
ncbi:MAG: ubiquitin-conjugating enzyme E2 [Chitinophagales bacterium]